MTNAVDGQNIPQAPISAGSAKKPAQKGVLNTTDIIQTVASNLFLKECLRMRVVSVGMRNALADDKIFSRTLLLKNLIPTLRYRRTLESIPQILGKFKCSPSPHQDPMYFSPFRILFASESVTAVADRNGFGNFGCSLVNDKRAVTRLDCSDFSACAQNGTYAVVSNMVWSCQLITLATGQCEALLLDAENIPGFLQRRLVLQDLFFFKDALLAVCRNPARFHHGVICRLEIHDNIAGGRTSKVLKLCKTQDLNCKPDQVHKVRDEKGMEFLCIFNPFEPHYNNTVLCDTALNITSSKVSYFDFGAEWCSNSRFLFSARTTIDDNQYLAAYGPVAVQEVAAKALWQSPLSLDRSGKKAKTMENVTLAASDRYVAVAYTASKLSQAHLEVVSLLNEKEPTKVFSKVFKGNFSQGNLPRRLDIHDRLLSYQSGDYLEFIDLEASGGPICIKRQPCREGTPAVTVLSPQDIRIVSYTGEYVYPFQLPIKLEKPDQEYALHHYSTVPNTNKRISSEKKE